MIFFLASHILGKRYTTKLYPSPRNSLYLVYVTYYLALVHILFHVIG
jgi:hypothetical protein